MLKYDQDLVFLSYSYLDRLDIRTLGRIIVEWWVGAFVVENVVGWRVRA